MKNKLRILQMDVRGPDRAPLRTLTSAEGESHIARKAADPHGRYGYTAIARKLRVTAKHPLSWH